jgi:hypothetical protein
MAAAHRSGSAADLCYANRRPLDRDLLLPLKSATGKQVNRSLTPRLLLVAVIEKKIVRTAGPAVGSCDAQEFTSTIGRGSRSRLAK